MNVNHPLAQHFDAYPALNRQGVPPSAAMQMIEAIDGAIASRGLSPDQVSDVHMLFCTDYRLTDKRMIWAFCVTVIMLGGDPANDFSVDSTHRNQWAWHTYEVAQLADFERVNDTDRFPGSRHPQHVKNLLARRTA